MTDLNIIIGTAYLLAGLAVAAWFWHNLVDRADPFERHTARWLTLIAWCVLAWPVVLVLGAVYSTRPGRRWVNRAAGFEEGPS